jgi:cytochrome c oxidase assembly protein subunit 15
VFVLVLLGAFTTSIGAGMVFTDWPLSNGSLNPAGWLGDIAMFAEHSHRLSAGLMTAVILVLFVWIRWTESRAWLRQLAAWALALIVVQALVGGLRVLLDRYLLESAETTVGRLFAMGHACLAQVFVCTLIALAAGLTRTWAESAGAAFRPSTQRFGKIACGLLLVQLGVAAVMRHSAAGLAIPSFPWSTPEGALLPDLWNFRVGIHFAHRVLALALAVALPTFVVAVWRDPAAGGGSRWLGAAVLLLLTLQIGLGIEVIRTYRSPYATTAHVVVGALTLATVFLLSLFTHRSRFEIAGAKAPRSPADTILFPDTTPA